MICTDKKMATRVATFGARKMTQEGYTFEPSPAGGNVRRADKKGYAVLFPTPEQNGLSGNCTCKFFQENQEFGTCKHIVWAGWQAEALAQEAERQAEEDRIGDEAVLWMERSYGREAMESDYLTRNFG